MIVHVNKYIGSI